VARVTFQVEELDCPTEAVPIRAALEGAGGVQALDVDYTAGQVRIDYDPARATPESLAERLRAQTGFSVRVVEAGCGCCAGAPGAVERPAWWRRWLPVAVSGVAVAVGHVLAWVGGPVGVVRGAFAVPLAVAAVTIVPRAVRSLRRLRFDIHVLMGLAILGAVALGQWDEGAMVAFLFGLSEALEAMSLERARQAVRALLEVAPEQADRIGPDGTPRPVAAASLAVGDRVLVRPGARIPADGRVAAGRSAVDQRSITGESVPVLREVGDPVYAGTVNGEGALEVEVEQAPGRSLVARMAEQVRAAQRGRTPIERTVERFAAVYTPLVIVLAAAVMIGPPLFLGGDPRWWFHQGLVVLIIACPCALVIATPVAVVAALAAASRRGILIKGGEHLEAVGRLRALAFDKTGTLTLGEPDVVEVTPIDGRAAHDVVRMAAAVGDRGGHVVGRAIARHARKMQLDVPRADDYRAVPGLGASARIDATEYHVGSHRYLHEAGVCEPRLHGPLGAAETQAGTSVAVTAVGQPLGWLRLADRPRPEAAATLADLHQLGIESVMLTGDNPATAAALARELGIRNVYAGLLPEQKAEVIRRLNAQRGPVGMVGDGVNDAPALAAAPVSISLGGISSGAALEAADIVLMGDDLSGLPWLVRHSRRTRAIIRANIALAVTAKLIFLALAIVGWANLWTAILADLGVSLIVVANALRLLHTPTINADRSQPQSSSPPPPNVPEFPDR
jgi:Cd2+/Zn2+-exporting ATPase